MPVRVKPHNEDAISYFVGTMEFVCITRYKFIKVTVKEIIDAYKKGEANTFLIDGRGKIVISDGFATFYYNDGRKVKVKANRAKIASEIRQWYLTYDKEKNNEQP